MREKSAQKSLTSRSDGVLWVSVGLCGTEWWIVVISHTRGARVPGVMNLIDSFAHSIDDKGRLVLPSAYRDEFAGGATLSAKGDHIACYTPAAWEDFLTELRAKRREGLITRSAFNLVQGLSSSVKADSQGRVMLSPRIRQSAGLEREVIVQGADDYLAIYRPDAWDAEGAPTIADVAARLDELGL